jgi:ABC-2 type transport system ATP-binding protein
MYTEQKNPAVAVSNLRKRFGEVQALGGISFQVAAGEIYGLLGPNGAGKSTTIGVLCGLVTPDAGSARLNGLDVVQQPVEARRTLGVVPQEVALYRELSARDNLAFFGRLYGLRGAELRARIDDMLARVALGDRAREPVERYSGGMMRRLNIAAGVLHRPRVVLLDEPTVGLDPQTRINILDLVRTIAREGAAVVYTTHYMDEAERLCDRIAIMDHGTILAEGTLGELRRAAGEREIVALRGSFRADGVPAALGAVPDLQVIKTSETELLVSLQSAERQLSSLLAAAAAFGDVREVAVKQPSRESLHQADRPGAARMRAAAVIAAHHLKRIARNPGLILLLMAIPITLALIEYAAFGPMASSGKLPPIKVLVLDEDRTFASSAVPRLLGAGPLADYIEFDTAADTTSARRTLQRGQASALVVVPKGFQQAILDRGRAELRLARNPAQTFSPEIVDSMLQMLAAIVNGLLAQAREPIAMINTAVIEQRQPTEAEVAEISRGFYRAGERLQILDEFDELTVNVRRPAGTSQPFDFDSSQAFFGYIFPGLVLFGLMFISQALAMRLLRDRELGLQRRVAIAPASPGAIVAGGVVYMFIALVGLMALLASLGAVIFRIELKHPVTLLALAVGFALFATGLQLTVSAFARSERGAQAVVGIVIMVLSLLGGAFVPLESYPPFLQSVGRALPNGAAHQAFVDVLVRGRTLGDLLRPAAITWGWAVALLALAVVAERRRLS